MDGNGGYDYRGVVLEIYILVLGLLEYRVEC